MLLIEITVISIFFKANIENTNRIALNIACRLASKTASNSQKPTRRNQNIILRRKESIDYKLRVTSRLFYFQYFLH